MVQDAFHRVCWVGDSAMDEEAILDHAADVPVIVTLEEHTVVGGLGSAVAELIAEAGFDPGKQFKRIGLPDVFPDEYGSQDSLMQRYSITAQNVVAVVRDLSETPRREPRPV